MYGNSVLSLILINIFIYCIILTNIFLVFFLHDTRYIKTINEFKSLFSNNYYVYILVLSILSMAGMPPLLGFFGKFFIVVFFFKKSQLFLFILFIFINVFVIYFYIINIRFIITKSNKSYFFIKNYTTYLSFPIICLLLFFFLLNFFGIFFLSDFILFIDALTSFNF